MPHSKWNTENERDLLDELDLDAGIVERDSELGEPERDPDFTPTHTIGGIPVMQHNEPGRRYYYTDENGDLVNTTIGRNVVKIMEFETYIPPNVLPENQVLLEPEVCAAVFRCAAFPMLDSPITLASTGNGHEAVLSDPLEDGTRTVMVNRCGMSPVRVKLPMQVMFEKV